MAGGIIHNQHELRKHALFDQRIPCRGKRVVVTQRVIDVIIFHERPRAQGFIEPRHKAGGEGHKFRRCLVTHLSIERIRIGDESSELLPELFHGGGRCWFHGDILLLSFPMLFIGSVQGRCRLTAGQPAISCRSPGVGEGML